VLAIGDLFPEVAKEKAVKYEVPVAGDVATVLDHPDVHIVVNLTIPAAHAEIATQVIAAGKHVWNEKPLTLDRVSGRTLLQGLRRLDCWLAALPTPFWAKACKLPAG
jgi:predicted dehydrogenase